MKARSDIAFTASVDPDSVLQKYVFAGLLVVICIVQAQGHIYTTLMGDDLANLTAISTGQLASNFQQALLGIQYDKWRPIIQVIFWLQFQLFKFDLSKYIFCNIAVHAASSLLLYASVLRLAPQKRFIAFTAAALFAISRFAGFQLYQATGLVEGLSTFLIVAAVFFYVGALVNGRVGGLWAAAACWAAACYTHERYLVLLPAVCLAAFFWSSPQQRAARAGIAAAAVLAAAANIAYKAFSQSGKFLVGTGGTDLDFKPGRLMQFFGSALANSFGFNLGQSYLSAEAMKESSHWIWTLSALIALLTLLALAGGLASRGREALLSSKTYGPLAVLAVSILMAALVASVTIRQEFRWILTVYLFVLLGVAAGLSSLKAGWVGSLLAGLLLATTLVQTLYYREREPNVFFFSEQLDVQRLLNLVDKNPRSNGEIYLVVEDPNGQCRWAYGHGLWFNIYGKVPAYKVHCVVGMKSLPPGATATGAQVIALAPRLGTAEDITDTLRGNGEMTNEASGTRLTASFDPSWLNLRTAVSTPSGLGAFQTDGWPTSLGPLQSLVVTAGFNVSVPVSPIAQGSELSFWAAMPYATTNPAEVWVGLRDHETGQIDRVWDQLMTGPPDNVSRPVLTRIPLGKRGANASAVVFGIDTPQGDGSSQWIAFSRAVVVPPGAAGPAAAKAPQPAPSAACDIVAEPRAMHRSTTWCRS